MVLVCYYPIVTLIGCDMLERLRLRHELGIFTQRRARLLHTRLITSKASSDKDVLEETRVQDSSKADAAQGHGDLADSSQSLGMDLNNLEPSMSLIFEMLKAQQCMFEDMVEVWGKRDIKGQLLGSRWWWWWWWWCRPQEKCSLYEHSMCRVRGGRRWGWCLWVNAQVLHQKWEDGASSLRANSRVGNRGMKTSMTAAKERDFSPWKIPDLEDMREKTRGTDVAFRGAKHGQQGHRCCPWGLGLHWIWLHCADTFRILAVRSNHISQRIRYAAVGDLDSTYRSLHVPTMLITISWGRHKQGA